MDNIVDFTQKKIDAEQPTIIEIIEGFTAHNCDKDRPYLEQQPERAKMEIKGLTRRDVCDCMVLGILESCPDNNFPKLYFSEEGVAFQSFEDLEAAGHNYKDHVIDHERATYNDVYKIGDIDPIAAVQNMACHLERRMGVFPALLDGKLAADQEPSDEQTHS